MTTADDLTPNEALHKAIQAGSLPAVKDLVKTGANLDHILGMKGTPLCAAIEAKQIDIANFLIQAGCDVNRRDYDGEPPLLLALRKEKPRTIPLRRECLEIAALLIQHPDCNVNVLDPLTKKTPIHFAIEQGMVEVVRWLVSRPSCDVNIADINGNTPLHAAVMNGLKDAVLVLVSCSSCEMNIRNKAGMAPLHICANNGDEESLELILNRLKSSDSDKMNPKLVLPLDKIKLDDSESDSLWDKGDGVALMTPFDIKTNPLTTYENETCLHLACRNEHKNVVQKLLKAGSKVDLKNSFGQSALLVACGTTGPWLKKDNSIPLMLLEAGASTNVKAPMRCRFVDRDLEVTCLILSAMSDNLELAKSLVHHGADLEITDNQGRAPLFVALWKNSVLVSQYLLHECIEKKVDLGVEDVNGNSLLYAAVKYMKNVSSDDKHKIIHLLVQNGAPIIPLDVCLESEDEVALDAILSSSDIHPEDIIYDLETGYTLLHTAAGIGSLPMVRVLLSHGDDINHMSPEGHTPLFCALDNHQPEVVRFLVNNGCDLSLERYIFEPDHCPTDKAKRVVVQHHDESSEDDSDESDVEDEDDSVPSGFVEDRNLARWLQSVAMVPRSLFLTCLVAIREHFRKHKLRLALVNTLSIPDELSLKLRYKS